MERNWNSKKETLIKNLTTQEMTEFMGNARKYEVGYTQTNRQGLNFTVIEYRNRKDMYRNRLFYAL